MTNFQDVLISASQDDTILQSASEFLEARINNSYALLDNLTRAAAGETNVLSEGVASKFVAVYQDSSLAWLDTARFISYLYSSLPDVNIYIDEANRSWDPTALINQVSDGIVAILAASESVKACVDAKLDSALSISSQLLNRLTLRFADLSDAAANYGFIFLDLIKDPGINAKEKVLSLLDFLGIRQAKNISSNIKPESSFNSITGANVWSAFAAEVATEADNAWEAVKASATKIWNGLSKIAMTVGGKFINKVKDAYLTVSTLKDSFGYNSDNKWGGFADYGTTTHFTLSQEVPEWYERAVDALRPIMSKLSSSSYIATDLPAGRMMLWADPNNANSFYVKMLYRPVNPTIITNFVNQGGELDTLDGLNEFSSFFNEYQDQYPFDLDHDLLYGVYWSKAINDHFLELWCKSLGWTLHYYLSTLFGDQYGTIIWTIPTNPTNLDLARRLTGHDSGNIYPQISTYGDDNELYQLIDVLNSLFNNDTYFAPYYHTNSMPNGQYWVMTDFQLADFATNAFISGAVIVAAVAAVLIVKKLKFAVYSLTARAGTLSFNAVGDVVNYSQMMQAYKLEKRANLLNSILSAMTGSVKTLMANMINGVKSLVSSAIITTKSFISGDTSGSLVPSSSDKSLKDIHDDMSGSSDEIKELIRGF